MTKTKEQLRDASVLRKLRAARIYADSARKHFEMAIRRDPMTADLASDALSDLAVFVAKVDGQILRLSESKMTKEEWESHTSVYTDSQVQWCATRSPDLNERTAATLECKRRGL